MHYIYVCSLFYLMYLTFSPTARNSETDRADRKERKGSTRGHSTENEGVHASRMYPPTLVLTTFTVYIQDSKSHHARELKAAEQGLSKAKKEAESIVHEAKANEQEMQALQLELEELTKSLESQQQQVRCDVDYQHSCYSYRPTARCQCRCHREEDRTGGGEQQGRF